MNPRLRAAAYLLRRLVLGGEVQRFAPSAAPRPKSDVPAEDGVLDGVVGQTVRGWARRIDHPEGVARVDLYLDDDYLGRAFCDLAREDLAGLAGFATGGRNAFSFPLPSHALRIGGRLRAVTSGSGLELAGSPIDLRGALRLASAQQVRELFSRGWYVPAAAAATSLAEIERAYGRRLPVLTEPDPQAFDASWPVTAAMAHVNARLHDGGLDSHGAQAYVALLLAAAAHYVPTRAGLPMTLAQVEALIAPTGWLVAGHARSHLLIDVFAARQPDAPALDDDGAADLLTRFALEVLARRRLPIELLGPSARAFLRGPHAAGGRSRFEHALARSAPFASMPAGVPAALAEAAVRTAAEDLGFGELVLEAVQKPVEPVREPLRPGVRVISADYGDSGLSLNARHSLAALSHLGVACEPALAPVSPEVPCARYDALARPAFAAALIHATPEDAVEIILRLPPEQMQARLIGFFMWETEGLPERHRLGARLVDEVWTASRFCESVFRAAAPAVPVQVVGHAVEPPDPEPGFDARAWAGVGPDDFVFLFHFDAHSWITRKNPTGLVRAFRRAFPGGKADARLVVKLRHAEDADRPWWSNWWAEFYEEAGRDPRIVIAHADLSGRQMAALTASADAFVSLHRAEGFGYALAEAMAAGKPLVATGYSGNLDFTLPGEALLVPAAVRPVRPREFLHSGPQQAWGEPDLDAAAAAMRRLYEDRALGRRLGALGRQRVLSACSMHALAANYARCLAPDAASPSPARQD